MTWLTDMKWVSPWAFIGLLFLGGIIFIFNKRSRLRKRVSVPGPMDYSRYGSWRTRLLPILPILLFTALALSIISLANPQRINALQKITADGIDIFIVMDLSHSMLEKDFNPSRIAVAKEAAKTFVEKRKNDRIGLVPFGTTAYTQCPLTMDHKVVQKFLSEMRVDMVGPSTAIGLGLATAVNRLKDSDANSKVIVLFTDGINNVFSVDPLTAAELARQYGIKVYTIGMTKISQSGEIGVEQLGVHEDNLKEIASMTDGKYYRATSRNALEKIYNEIDALERTEMEVTIIERADLKYHIFLLPAWILLLLWFIVSRTFLKTFIP